MPRPGAAAQPAPAPASSIPALAGKVDVALLLPLSGPNAVLGTDMEDAAMLAVSEMNAGSIAITPKDTKGTEEGAMTASSRSRRY